MDSSIGGPLGMLGNVGQNGNMGLQAFYGVFIGFASLALLGTLLTACCDKYGCRHLIYFSCLIMFLVGLIGALLSTLFSFLIPAFTWGCSYLDTTIASQAGFTSRHIFMQLTWEVFWAQRLLNFLLVCLSEMETLSTRLPLVLLLVHSTVSKTSLQLWEASTTLSYKVGFLVTWPRLKVQLTVGYMGRSSMLIQQACKPLAIFQILVCTQGVVLHLQLIVGFQLTLPILRFQAPTLHARWLRHSKEIPQLVI